MEKMKEVEEKTNKQQCTICGHKLQKRKPGYVCKNWKCPLYWKLGVGYVFQITESGYVIDNRLPMLKDVLRVQKNEWKK